MELATVRATAGHTLISYCYYPGLPHRSGGSPGHSRVSVQTHQITFCDLSIPAFYHSRAGRREPITLHGVSYA